MTHGIVQYKGAVGRRGPSNIIWADCPISQIQQGLVAGHYHYDDFINHETMAAGAAAINYGNYYASLDTGVVVANVADVDFGEIQCNTMDTANDGGVIAHGAHSGFARFGTNAADHCWFEARFKKASVTNDALGFFLGFAEADVSELTATAALVDTTGEMDASQDFVGFHNDPDDGDLLECVYQEGGATHVDVGDAITTMVVDTYYKTGLKWDGQRQLLSYYVDEALVQTLSVTSALSFPDANHLCGLWAFKSVLTADSTMNVDWWAWASTTDETHGV